MPASPGTSNFENDNSIAGAFPTENYPAYHVQEVAEQVWSAYPSVCHRTVSI